jgi:pimeloyl-ACP methyl ester carboxylesterase
MQKARVNGVELEFETKGTGEPVLLVTCGPIADAFWPFMSERSLTDRHRLIRYHRRGMVGSSRTTPPVSFSEHAADAAGLLGHLGVARAHVVGHSTGACVALQLAAEHPDLVHTLALLEPTLPSARCAADFFARVGPFLQTYATGDHERAMAGFISAVCTLDWETCRSLLDRHVPGGVTQAVKDADNFFGSELPALGAWQFGPEQAAGIEQPVLSVLGSETEEFFKDGHELLHSWFAQLEDCSIAGVGHLLQMQRPEPVARGVAEFLARHSMTESTGTAQLPPLTTAAHA